MADSVSGVPVFTLADLKTIGEGANGVGEAVDRDSFTITTPGTNASLGAVVGGVATSFATSGAGTGGTVTVTTDVTGAVTAAVFTGGTGYSDTDTITITEIDGDAMDTNTVLTIDAVQVVRDRWNATVTVAVSDHPADEGDGMERAYFVQHSLNNVWRLGNAKLGGEPGNEDGPQIVIPEPA